MLKKRKKKFYYFKISLNLSPITIRDTNAVFKCASSIVYVMYFLSAEVWLVCLESF